MMGVFRLQNNVPQVYVDKSRDFQMMCRVLDTLHGSVMYDITTMQNLTNPMKINDTMLRLYATKVGFFTNVSIDSNVLRYIVSAFPYIVKNKGNIRGIRRAVATIIRAESVPDSMNDYNVVIDNSEHRIDIYTFVTLKNRVALEEVLKYVIPTGYDVHISSAVEAPGVSTKYTYDTNSETVLHGDYPYYESGLRKNSEIDIKDGNDQSVTDDDHENSDLNVRNTYDTNIIVPQSYIKPKHPATEEDDNG